MGLSKSAAQEKNPSSTCAGWANRQRRERGGPAGRNRVITSRKGSVSFEQCVASAPDGRVAGHCHLAPGLGLRQQLVSVEAGSGDLVAIETLVAGFPVEAVGGSHAEIHRDIPRIGNVGLVLTSPGDPTFFHPGDELDAVPEGVDVVAVPMMGPWAAMKEQIDFLRALGAPEGFGIHEGLLSERGWQLAQDRYSSMTPTRVHDLRGGTPWRPGGR